MFHEIISGYRAGPCRDDLNALSFPCSRAARPMFRKGIRIGILLAIMMGVTVPGRAQTRRGSSPLGQNAAVAQTDAPAATRSATANKSSRTTARAGEEGAETTTLDIPVLSLTGVLPDRPGAMTFSLEAEEPLSLYDVIERLAKAGKDPRVPAVVLTLDDPWMGWAQMQELRAALQRLRKAGKEVYCYLEEASLGSYLLATGSSRICLSEGGWLDVRGLYLEGVYLKGLLDKIGVQADIEHVGAYKGAGEPFTRTGPSPEAAEMLEWLTRDLFEQMVECIAEGRDLSVDQVRAIVDRGPFNARQALEAGLVDEVLDANTFVAGLKKRYGDELTLDHEYGTREKPQMDFSNPFAFFKIFGDAMKGARTKASPKPAVAVVYLEGEITTGESPTGFFGESTGAGSTTLRRRLTEVRRDRNIKAVVLRIDSPGGSAVASDIIWQAGRELAEVKPLVVSMGNVAASGGYYSAVSAPTIFADPATITGSIGVIGGKLVTRGLWDWLGVNFHETALGRNADLDNTNRPYDDRQRAIIRDQLEYVYRMFLDRVRQGRERQLTRELETIAGGRVYTGRQALALGLVDRLGGLHEAIAYAAEQANLTSYDIRLVPEPKDFLQLIVDSLSGQRDEKWTDQVRSPGTLPVVGGLHRAPAVRSVLEALQRLDPPRARAVARLIRRLDLLTGESALCLMPDEWLPR